MIVIVCSVVQGLASLYILWRGLIALNSMNRHTRNSVRFAYVALVVGAMAAITSCFMMRDLFQCLFVVGVAAHFYFNKRSHHAP